MVGVRVVMWCEVAAFAHAIAPVGSKGQVLCTGLRAGHVLGT